jgi:hypothetical protein
MTGYIRLRTRGRTGGTTIGDARRGMRRRWSADDGSTLPLVGVFTALAVLVVLVGAAASSLHLERMRLLDVADGAALVGAESFALAGGVIDGRPRLDAAEVDRAARDYLAAAEGGSGLDEVVLERAGTDDGRSATVTLSTTWRPPVIAFLAPDGVRIEATSVARAVFE